MTMYNTRQIQLSPRRITMVMVICGLAGAAFTGAAGAATADEGAAAVTVRYSRQSLSTDSGARELYSRLVKAAAAVCPQGSDSPRWISDAVRECREQSVARAVLQVNNPRLASVYVTRSKSG
jgi:UrcA family protein